MGFARKGAKAIFNCRTHQLCTRLAGEGPGILDLQKRGKTEWVLQQRGGDQIRNPNTDIGNTRSGGAEFEAQSRKSPNFGLLATCVAGGRNAAAPGAQL
jgi:hypothetical protein